MNFSRTCPASATMSIRLAKRTEESFKAFVTPGMLFEAFNFEYFGPINGHKIDHLIDILNNIIHAKNPCSSMSPPPKEKDIHRPKRTRFISTVSAVSMLQPATASTASHAATQLYAGFGQTLVELGAEDPRIVAVTAAMPEGTGLVQICPGLS